jgi:Fe-S cluster biogenesis protein NfuA
LKEPSLDLRAVGDRIEAVVDQLRSSADPRLWELIEEALGLVTELYGGGLARVLDLVDEEAKARLATDELVGSLLILHDLHPMTLEDRVRAALDEVRPYLGSHGGDVEVLGVDAAAGVLHLKMLGACDGCPSSAVTLQMAVREAIAGAAPEIVDITVEEATPVATPVQLGRR